MREAGAYLQQIAPRNKADQLVGRSRQDRNASDIAGNHAICQRPNNLIVITTKQRGTINGLGQGQVLNLGVAGPAKGTGPEIIARTLPFSSVTG